MAEPQGILVMQKWQQLLNFLQKSDHVDLDGRSLTVPALVAVANYNAAVYLDQLPDDAATKVDASVELLADRIARGQSVYGVTTGFDGSANTHTLDTWALQKALIQMQLSGVLPYSRPDQELTSSPFQNRSYTQASIYKLSMPEAWVRGAMVVRSNSLLRGHSAVRLKVIQAVVKLLEHNLIPVVPLRGSISASGDLCPLSYVAATLEGNPDVDVWTDDSRNEMRITMPANEALKRAGISSITFGPKETLGLLNGSAFSVAVASSCHHEADTLAVLAQILTAMGVEALVGTVESFNSFIGNIRPHPGQVEIAGNIRAFLHGSGLARNSTQPEEYYHDQLRQDRYPLRTSSQWMGPYLEDMGLAREQLEVELNSTTDNPLIDIENGKIYHGGNFQASSVTSSTEKTRSALEKIGKMIFAQSTELLNSQLSHNLPPNLAVDEPSLSYPMKGIDINMAAYMSELSFLANPVGNHVHSAEMGNQAINSLALILARYTHTAVDVVSLMVSAHLYTLCQALDLRAMNNRFMRALQLEVKELIEGMFGIFPSREKIVVLHQEVCSSIVRSLSATTSMDSNDRFVAIAHRTQHHIVRFLEDMDHEPPKSVDSLSLITVWTSCCADTLRTVFCTNRQEYLANPDATEVLGSASKRMYTFVRNELKVPMHCGLADHPYHHDPDLAITRRNTGTYISFIHRALRVGQLAVPIMECLEEAITLQAHAYPDMLTRT